MKEWYFSNNGELNGPLGLAESIKYVKTNPNTYAWHPSYAYWMPVSDIADFEMTITPPPSPIEIPLDLIESFLVKEKELNTALGRIETTLQVIGVSMSDLDRDTISCKNKTQNLNEQVKATIRAVNEQYEALQKALAGVSSSHT
ncbi:DUF4339 domain-containing protein [Shewanella glacialimarina]|jgi:hypothetical protein|uniref:DUF4339 domain-containing protein n=1 Tax=Shewanella glacialimarina TaxID=2590884 RepID=UPI001CF8E650|nr:DUF4339 domain-containing protein [Shewanella glacialimarina]UCX03604.1 DUF4339 domain-containing protein [Shewanella glacialimarina]